jgi:hypothetical protein
MVFFGYEKNIQVLPRGGRKLIRRARRRRGEYGGNNRNFSKVLL